MSILIKLKKKPSAPVLPPPPPPAPPPAGRRPGERAGISRDTILAAACQLLQSGGRLTVKAIADDLDVTPNSVHSRYPDGLAAIEEDLVRSFLDELVRSPHPSESWRSQFAALFDDALSLGWANPAVARLVANGIGSDALINPDLAEHVLYVLAFADVEPEDCPAALDLVLTVLCGALLVTCRGPDESSRAGPALDRRIQELPARRFPRLHECRAGLVDAAATKASRPSSPAEFEQPSAASRLCQLITTEFLIAHDAL